MFLMLASLVKRVSEEHWKLNKQIDTRLQHWSENKPTDKELDFSKALDILCENQVLFEKMLTDYKVFSKARYVLGATVVEEDHSELKIVLEELHSLKKAWTHIGEVWKLIYEIKGTSWKSLSVNGLKSCLGKVSALQKIMPTYVKQYDGYSSMYQKIREIERINVILMDFKSEIMRERHWNEIYSLLSFTNARKKAGLTLGDFWDSPIISFEIEIRNIISIAAGEASLEEFLHSVRNTWKIKELSFVPYQDKCRLVKGFDEILALCQEHLSALNAMSSSIYFSVFEDEALALERKLSSIHLIFDLWVDVQRHWIYLEGVFLGENEIGSILPIETTRFKTINVEFLHLMSKVYRIGKVFDIVAIAEFADSLKRFENLFDGLQMSLGEFLSLQRQKYPRFFFIGDEDLLEILGNSKDDEQMQRHIRKMIPGIASIHFHHETGDVVAIESAEREVISLVRPVHRKDLNLVIWLKTLEDVVCESLSQDLETSMSINNFLNDGFGIYEWIEVTPCQIAILRLQIWWTDVVERALRFPKSSTSHSLSDTLSHLEKVLEYLASLLVKELETLCRRKVESVLMELVHQRDVVTKLISDSIQSDDDFSWKSYMRYYYINTENNPRRKVSIQISNVCFFYGYEYLGVIDRLVQTPLTNRCYSALSQALKYQLVGSPFGPAGTGKTETVKALGAHLGRLVLVFNCDEHFNIASISRILVGICKVGAWGCFDEFNRLEERILSSVSQQIHSIQDGLRLHKEIELLEIRFSVKGDTGRIIFINDRNFCYHEPWICGTINTS